MVDQELSAVERMAALLEGIDAGLVRPGDAGSITVELVELVQDLIVAPAGWVADLGRMLQPELPRVAPVRASATQGTDQQHLTIRTSK